MQSLWDAFPTGYFPVRGTTTLGGQQVLQGKGTQILWYWPQEAQFSRQGNMLFDEARPAGVLLPDLEDEATRDAVRRFLAERVGLGAQGTTWSPKTQDVRDPARGSTHKTIVGWTLHAMTRRATFAIPDVKDGATALLQAVKLTNCACGRGSPRDCPLHGDIKARPWK